jgi:hypothetical protein
MEVAMGFLGKLLGLEAKLPYLASDTNAAKNLESMKGPLEELTKKVTDKMEVVPAEDRAYVFIGKPPKSFGMAWIEEGKMYNFKTLSEEKAVSQQQIMKMVDALAEAYKRSDSENRFSAEVGNKIVTVTPSPDLAKEVRNIIGNA